MPATAQGVKDEVNKTKIPHHLMNSEDILKYSEGNKT